jgi:hypothetical protein
MMAKLSESDLDQGGAAEEALRLYFQTLGAFVVRGVKVRAGRDYVTDIDLWVYTRASVHARHIAIVDIKNKRKSKGYERLIWLKGLQSAVGADEAIVATAASRDDLKPFSARLGIKLLSDQVFKAVVARFSNQDMRFSSEELDRMWRVVRIEGVKDLAALMETSLVELSLGLGFTAMNVWIDEAARLLVYCHDHERRPGPVVRAVLLLASLVAVCADYMGRNAAFADTGTRRTYFREGLQFGKGDEGTADRYLAFAEKVATDFVDRSGAAAASIRAGFQKAVENLPIGGFIELFARPAAGRELLDAAVQLEGAAFSRNEPNLASLPTEAKTIVALLVDYAGLDRRHFLQGMSEVGSRAAQMKELINDPQEKSSNNRDGQRTDAIENSALSSSNTGVSNGEPGAQNKEQPEERAPNLPL